MTSRARTACQVHTRSTSSRHSTMCPMLNPGRRCGWPPPGVLDQLCAGVQREPQPIVEREHRDRAGRVRLVSGELGGGDARRRQPQAVAVERHRALEVADAEREDVDAGGQRAPVF